MACILKVPPRFEGRKLGGLPEPEYENTQVIQGNTLRIQCAVNSYPTPTITWYKDDEELTEGDFGERLRIHQDGRELELAEVEEGDAGRYTCVARNLAGEAEKITDVEVIGELVAMSMIRTGLIKKYIRIQCRFKSPNSSGPHKSYFGLTTY